VGAPSVQSHLAEARPSATKVGCVPDRVPQQGGKLVEISNLIAVAGICACATLSHADVVYGTVTADNHYALYTSTGNVFSYHGGNETGAGGNPGRYNWSMAEMFEFQAGEYLFIAAWSDDAIAQGVLADFYVSNLGSISSGDSRWQVYASGINRGNGDAHPDASEIAGHVGFADSNELWETPYVGEYNGALPWGTIAGISEEAAWMWRDSDTVSDPLRDGFGQGEMLIFRTATIPIPAPGGAVALGLAGLALVRRRR
jgi:hypothetical protein